MDELGLTVLTHLMAAMGGATVGVFAMALLIAGRDGDGR